MTHTHNVTEKKKKKKKKKKKELDKGKRFSTVPGLANITDLYP